MVDPRRSRCRVPSRVQGKGDVAGGERSSSGQPGIPDAPDAFPFKQIKNNSQQNRVLKEPPEIQKRKLMYQGRLPVEFRNRTKAFAATAIRLFVKLPKNREEVRVLGKQLLRSGTSVAAQVREASRARSDEEFVSKLGGTLQETDETLLWLELLREECGIPPTNTLPIEKEADELMAIMTRVFWQHWTKPSPRPMRLPAREIQGATFAHG